MIRYRLIHVGSKLSMWRLDDRNLATLIGQEDNVCGEEHCDDYDCAKCRSSCDDAINRLSIAAESDYGVSELAWIAGDEDTQTVVYTLPLLEWRSA